MDRSGLAASATRWSAWAAIGESGWLVITSVGRLLRLASAITSTRSGDAPDCEMATTKAPSSRGGASYGP